MNAPAATPEPLHPAIPDALRNELEKHLLPGEQVLNCFEPNLDATLSFGEGAVILTNLALLGRQPTVSGQSIPKLQRWPISELREIKNRSSGSRSFRSTRRKEAAAGLAIHRRKKQRCVTLDLGVQTITCGKSRRR